MPVLPSQAGTGRGIPRSWRRRLPLPPVGMPPHEAPALHLQGNGTAASGRLVDTHRAGLRDFDAPVLTRPVGAEPPFLSDRWRYNRPSRRYCRCLCLNTIRMRDARQRDYGCEQTPSERRHGWLPNAPYHPRGAKRPAGCMRKLDAQWQMSTLPLLVRLYLDTTHEPCDDVVEGGKDQAQHKPHDTIRNRHEDQSSDAKHCVEEASTRPPTTAIVGE